MASYHCTLCDEQKRLIKQHHPCSMLNMISYWLTRLIIQQFCPRHFVETATLRGIVGSKNCNNDLRPIFDGYFPAIGSVPSTTFTGDVRKSFSATGTEPCWVCLGGLRLLWSHLVLFFFWDSGSRADWDLDIRPYDFLAWLLCLKMRSPLSMSKLLDILAVVLYQAVHILSNGP